MIFAANRYAIPFPLNSLMSIGDVYYYVKKVNLQIFLAQQKSSRIMSYKLSKRKDTKRGTLSESGADDAFSGTALMRAATF